MKVASRASSASEKTVRISSGLFTHDARRMPAPRATATRSAPAPVAVSISPEASYTSLSTSTCTRLGGFLRAMVGRLHRFMSSEPSPSMAMT